MKNMKEIIASIIFIAMAIFGIVLMISAAMSLK